jgi:hypothetical protein
LDLIAQYGADTLRFMLMTSMTPGNDMRFYWERVENCRNFANKIWNASRFALMNFADFDPGQIDSQTLAYTLADRWIISRLNRVITKVTGQLKKYQLGEAAALLYDFIWSEFCDWYIELAKPRLYNHESTGCPTYCPICALAGIGQYFAVVTSLYALYYRRNLAALAPSGNQHMCSSLAGPKFRSYCRSDGSGNGINYGSNPGCAEYQGGDEYCTG